MRHAETYRFKYTMDLYQSFTNFLNRVSITVDEVRKKNSKAEISKLKCLNYY